MDFDDVSYQEWGIFDSDKAPILAMHMVRRLMDCHRMARVETAGAAPPNSQPPYRTCSVGRIEPSVDKLAIRGYLVAWLQ